MGLTQVKSKQLLNDGILEEDLSPELRKRLLIVVRAATTTSGTLSTDFQNASVIDGVTLATDDIILLKNQASSEQNGVYIVNASGAPTRHPYYNSDAAIRPSTIQVKEGSSNGSKIFKCNNVTAITVNTTAITYSEVGGTSSGGGKTITAIQTANGYTSANNQIVRVDSTAGSFTTSLPAAPADGDEIEYVDVGGVAATNPITINRNGNSINGSATDLSFDVNWARIVFIYSTSLGWSVQ